MGWPRGKYNGLRIVGFRVIFVIDVTEWKLRLGSISYGNCTAIGPFRFWLAAEYESRWKDPHGSPRLGKE